MNPRTIDTKYVGKNAKGEVAELHVPMRELWGVEITDFYDRLNESKEKPVEERKGLQFAVFVDAVASWVADMPYILVNGKRKPFTDKSVIAEAVREYFKEANIQNDRILNSLINQVISESSATDIVF